MPVPLIYPEKMLSRFRAGTFDALGRVQRDGETRADLVREAVELLLHRRNKAGPTRVAPSTTRPPRRAK